MISALNGSPQGRDRAGQVFVVYGRDGASQGRFPAQFELAQLLARNGGDGGQGFVINGDAALLQAGRQIAVGDVNDDGLGDVLITSQSATPDEDRPAAGRTFVLYGRSQEDR